MLHEHKGDSSGGLFRLRMAGVADAFPEPSDLIHIIWNRSDEAAELEIDGYRLELAGHAITTITYLHMVRVVSATEQLTVFSFNRDYYCIRDHDSEVSCNGLIFFGARNPPVINLDENDTEKLELLLRVFLHEFQEDDRLRGEMLLLLLKRLIIICTRLARNQTGLAAVPPGDVDLYRRFHYLVEQHFREVKTVAAYSEMLGRSAKTLANLFRDLKKPTPLRIIHDRITLEARRLLLYSEKSVLEISEELGFEEPAPFFKLFKKCTGVSPKKFRETEKKIALREV